MYEVMFGHTLRMLRTTAGISLRSLAKKIDVSPAYLSQIELGKQPPPTHSRIAKIADIIGIPMALLMEMSHRPNPEVIMLLRGNQELNKLIKVIHESRLRKKDITRIIALIQKLGANGFRKLIQHGADHLSDFAELEKRTLPFVTSSPLFDGHDFSNGLNPQLLFKSLKFSKKTDLLWHMLEKVGDMFPSFDLNRAHRELMSHEAEDSSGIGRGVALPHLYIDGLDRTVIAMARIPEGIDFAAIDKKPVYLVCLILSNPNSCQSHLNWLAYFAQKFQIPALLDEILKADSKKAILSLLSRGHDDEPLEISRTV